MEPMSDVMVRIFAPGAVISGARALETSSGPIVFT
jgi:hypothetical protein